MLLERKQAEHAAFTDLRDGRRGAREEMVERYLPLVRHLARRYAHTPEPLEDLVQVGTIGLLHAIDRFDIDSGNAFTTFAVPTILGEIRRHFRDKTWSVHVPRPLKQLAADARVAAREFEAASGRSPTAAEIADHLGVDVERLLDARMAADAQYPDSLDAPRDDGDDDLPSLEHQVGDEDPRLGETEAAVALSQITSSLAPRDREILRLRFEQDLLQREIAERVGISQMQVSRRLRDALELLHAQLDESRRDGESPARLAG
jgi:RNA polymerase sigma-B factor